MQRNVERVIDVWRVRYPASNMAVSQDWVVEEVRLEPKQRDVKTNVALKLTGLRWRGEQCRS
jgi:hypothetical protein